MNSHQAGVTRREMLKSAAGVAVAHAALPIALGSGSPTPLPQRLIPADKGFTPEQIAALWKRGEPRVYRGRERGAIGMPCGGVGAGQLYVLGDGRLAGFAIDGYRRFSGYGRDNYNSNPPPRPIRQGFSLAWETPDGDERTATLDDDGFDAIEFEGRYPVARIRYRSHEATKPRSHEGEGSRIRDPGSGGSDAVEDEDRKSDAAGAQSRTRDPESKTNPLPPLAVELEVFSPFIPLSARESAWPATVLRFSVRNTSDQIVNARLTGWLQNMAFSQVVSPLTFELRNRVVREAGLTSVVMDAVDRRPAPSAEPQRRVLYDFESGTYQGWTVRGEAFGDAPAAGTLPNQQPVSGFQGRRLVNSFLGGDEPRGRMISEPFTIDLPFLTFLIGGGSHEGRTCMNLMIGEKVVRTQAGRDSERLERAVWDVREFAGREARLEILDRHARGWGHVNIDDIALTNVLPEDFREYDDSSPGNGSVALNLIGEGSAAEIERSRDQEIENSAPSPKADRPVGSVTAAFEIAPGESQTATFIVSWFFPNLHTNHGVMYANWFSDAFDVGRQLAADLDRLRGQTLAFCDAYYEGTTLPWWLSSRLMMPISTLATGTSQWWKNGRFWGWEGVGCCEGTCTHVWNYAQGHAFLFPELARSARVMQDLGEGFDEATGLVGFRSNRAYAADGQAGTILKCYRELLLSGDDGFLREHWPRIQKALEYLITQDQAPSGSSAAGGGPTAGEGPPGSPAGEPDGVIVNSQHNTFDINFVGANTFVGSLYLAALRAGEQMATRVGDADAAARYRKIFEAGRDWSAANLFNGEYYEQQLPPDSQAAYQYGGGCLSDQLFGQNWARVLGLGDLYPNEQVRKALQAVYQYNWAPDVGPLNQSHPPERWFARPGEGGLFTCTWPRGGRPETPVRYRDEVWTGIEYQVAAGLAWEGLVDEAAVMVRAIDERYDGSKHNPWNEVECGDHYARAMASWGVLLALAGFEFDGPAGRIGFAPRVQADDFRCFFVAGTAWGVIDQSRSQGGQRNGIRVEWGSLTLREVVIELPEDWKDAEAAPGLRAGVADLQRASQPRMEVSATSHRAGRRCVARFEQPVTLGAGRRLDLNFES